MIREIDVYPTGVLAALIHEYGAVRCGQPMQYLRQELRYLLGNLRHRKWRQARMQFNGYMAEPKHHLDGLKRCGTGWTRSRALDSLGREMAKAGHIMVRSNYS